ncbi:Uncharacterised protein [Mycobacteroides abscessus subsp. abscessus]|nr:Uncharacterised protein [Mycobacteroides abscessus subsp. abscessus]
MRNQHIKEPPFLLDRGRRPKAPQMDLEQLCHHIGLRVTLAPQDFIKAFFK